MRGSYSRHVSSLLDTDEFGDSGPWMSPGAAAQRPPRLLLTLLGDYWWQRTEQRQQQPRRPLRGGAG